MPATPEEAARVQEGMTLTGLARKLFGKNNIQPEQKTAAKAATVLKR